MHIGQVTLMFSYQQRLLAENTGMNSDYKAVGAILEESGVYILSKADRAVFDISWA